MWIVSTIQFIVGLAAFVAGAVCIAQFPHLLSGTSYIPRARALYAPAALLLGAALVFSGVASVVLALR
jgi:hypothetical protein